MRELSGLSHEEIAISLGISVGAANQTIYEARRSLFEFAECRAMDCDEIRKTVSDADGRAVRARRVRAHLHECAGCAAFAAAIPARRAELRALAPSLPMLAAAGLLERILGTSAGHGAGVGLTTVAGKTASAALTANALAAAAVVATATIGVTLGVGTWCIVRGTPPGSAPPPRQSPLGRQLRSRRRRVVASRHRVPCACIREVGQARRPRACRPFFAR